MSDKIKKQIWGDSDDGEFEFMTITEDLFKQALDIIRDVLVENGTIGSMIKIKDHPEAVEEEVKLNKIYLEDGASVCAVEKKTRNVASVQINKIMLRPNPDEKNFFTKCIETCNNEAIKAKLFYASGISSKINLFDHYKADCILKLQSLGTKREYQHRNLAYGVTKYSVDLAKAQARGEVILPKYPTHKIQAVYGNYTATYSQRIGLKMGFDCLNEGNNEFIYNNVTYKPERDDQQTYLLCGMKIL